MPISRTENEDTARTKPGGFSIRWLILVLALLALIAGMAQSQLAVKRVELVMQVADGVARDAAIGVQNESDRPVQAIVRLEDWDRASDGTNQWYAYGTHGGAGSCGAALSIFPQALRLEPGAEQTIRVVLDGAKAPRQECWAAAIVETVQPAEAGQLVTYLVRTAVKIYVQPSNLTADGEIEAIRIVDDTKADSDESTLVEVLFANTGARHVVAEGMLEVRRPDNSVVTRVRLPTIYALPGAHHAVRVRMPALKSGSYVLLATEDFGGSNIAAALLEHRSG